MTELPPPNTRRWVPRRKAAVVAAVSSGLITIEEACRRYHMSEEEFIAWRCAFENFGINGLSAGRIQQQRGRGLPRAGDPAKSSAASRGNKGLGRNVRACLFGARSCQIMVYAVTSRRSTGPTERAAPPRSKQPAKRFPV